MEEGSYNKATDLLFGTEGENVFVILDGASVDGLLKELRSKNPRHVCLYRGELAPDLAVCAPYLVQLEPGAEFSRWVLRKGWGKHWGIFAVSPSDLRQMRLHFRKFLKVKSPEGKTLYFRYYDPRVMRVYLPTCNAEEMKTVFGSISSYIMEGEDPGVLLRAVPSAEKPRIERVRLGEGVAAR